MEENLSSILNSDDKREIIKGSSPGGERMTFEIIYNKKNIRFSIYIYTDWINEQGLLRSTVFYVK